MLEITALSALSDNYIYLLHEPVSGTTAVVDPSLADPVIRELERTGRTLDLILNTHHHNDHIGGNADLKRRYGCQVIGPASDHRRIATMDQGVKDGDLVQVGKASAKVLFVPGHTTGHIALWFEPEAALFCGDTLFSLGCGRLFEGTAAQMWASLSRLAALPATTRVYCGHEYTLANGRFALSVDPTNVDLQERMAVVRDLRTQKRSTLPSTIDLERRTNPFLRAGSAARFAELREAKDHFRG